MHPSHYARAAQLLATVRRDRTTLAEFPIDCRPRTIDDGYAVQAAFRKTWMDPIAGWKVGATALPVQQLFKIDHPFYGPVYRANVHASPAAPPSGAYRHLMIESEFAFRLGRDLPARSDGYTKGEIEAAFDAVMPAIEIVGGRFTSLTAIDVTSIIADCATNSGEVLGAPVTGWREDALIAQRVRLEVNGRIVGDGSGADVLGSPVRVLEWMITDMSRRGIDMHAGQFVSTGTCTGVVTIAPGERAMADFGKFGRVEVCFQ